MARSKGRRLVYAPEDVVNELMELATKKGIAFQDLVDRGLRSIVKALRMGMSLDELEALANTIQAQRASGLTLIPIEVLRFIEDKVDGRELESKWLEAGSWYGKYLKGKVEDPIKFLRNLLKATRWELDELEVIEEGDSIVFRCISSALSMKGTNCLKSFIEGAMQSLGYEVEGFDQARGILMMKFKKK